MDPVTRRCRPMRPRQPFAGLFGAAIAAWHFISGASPVAAAELRRIYFDGLTLPFEVVRCSLVGLHAAGAVMKRRRMRPQNIQAQAVVLRRRREISAAGSATECGAGFGGSAGPGFRPLLPIAPVARHRGRDRRLAGDLHQPPTTVRQQGDRLRFEHIRKVTSFLTIRHLPAPLGAYRRCPPIRGRLRVFVWRATGLRRPLAVQQSPRCSGRLPRRLCYDDDKRIGDELVLRRIQMVQPTPISSCPDLIRASPWSPHQRSAPPWMAGSSPAMTVNFLLASMH